MQREMTTQHHPPVPDSTDELLDAAEGLFAPEDPGAPPVVLAPFVMAKVSGDRDQQSKKAH